MSHNSLPYHYLSVGNIPVHNRAPDDFQPRAQLRKLFVEGNIKCGDNDKIEAFSKKYIVSPDLVKEYLEHLTNIEVRKNMRQDKSVRQRKMKKQKITVTITGRNSTNRET